jgi:hypothetical protein
MRDDAIVNPTLRALDVEATIGARYRGTIVVRATRDDLDKLVGWLRTSVFTRIRPGDEARVVVEIAAPKD